MFLQELILLVHFSCFSGFLIAALFAWNGRVLHDPFKALFYDKRSDCTRCVCLFPVCVFVCSCVMLLCFKSPQFYNLEKLSLCEKHNLFIVNSFTLFRAHWPWIWRFNISLSKSNLYLFTENLTAIAFLIVVNRKSIYESQRRSYFYLFKHCQLFPTLTTFWLENWPWYVISFFLTRISLTLSCETTSNLLELVFLV